MQKQTKSFEYLHYWLEGKSSTAEMVDQCPKGHRETIKVICGFAEGGIHGEIAAHDMANVYRSLSRIFRMAPLTPADVNPWLGRWKKWSEEGHLTSILKWWGAALYSYAVGQPLPAVPAAILHPKGEATDWVKPPLFSQVIPGRAGRFLKSVVRKLRKKLCQDDKPLHSRSLGKALHLRFLNKGTAVVSKEEIRGGLLKHRKALTEVDGFRARDEGHKSLLRRLMVEIRRTTIEVFGRETFVHREKPYFPSRKGHFNSPGIEGGAATYVLLELQGKTRAFRGFGLHPDKAVNLTPLTDESQHAFALRVVDLLGEEIVSEEPFLASPIAVPEPCKVRVVTKGPEFAYWYLRDLQQFMWRVLKKHPCFALIGEPISGELLAKRFRGTPQGTTFVSGDYKDSTNCLMAKMSRGAAKCLADCVGLSALDRKIFIASLVGHTLEYKEGEGRKAKSVRLRQTNGQLMGSPSSFPILCLINAAICRYAMETNGFDAQKENDWADEPPRFMSLREAPLLVNGDDCVFAIDKDFRFCLWEKIAGVSGMESSVGKTYVSAKFIQMNSTTYIIEAHPVVRESSRGCVRHVLPSEIWFSLVPYVNVGFLSPFDPKGGRERTYRDLPALARKFIEGHTPERADEMMGWFLRDHKKILGTLPVGMSYWLPAHLGGLGLPITRHLGPEHFSDFQLNFAEFLLHHEEEPTTFPSEEKEVPEWVRAGERCASKMRQRQKGDRNPNPWGDERQIREDEQFVYWAQALLPSLDENAVVPASSGNFYRLRKRFMRPPKGGAQVRAHSPIGTLLTDPSPHMVMKPGLCDLVESQGYHPWDLYGRIASIVEDRPYEAPVRPQGRHVYLGGMDFELFEGHFCIRSDRHGEKEKISSCREGLMMSTIVNDCQKFATRGAVSACG